MTNHTSEGIHHGFEIHADVWGPALQQSPVPSYFFKYGWELNEPMPRFISYRNRMLNNVQGIPPLLWPLENFFQFQNDILSFAWDLFLILFWLQESPPAWTQETYQPLCSQSGWGCGQTDGWMDGQTRVKTLPSPILRMLSVNMLNFNIHV